MGHADWTPSTVFELDAKAEKLLDVQSTVSWLGLPDRLLGLTLFDRLFSDVTVAVF